MTQPSQRLTICYMLYNRLYMYLFVLLYYHPGNLIFNIQKRLHILLKLLLFLLHMCSFLL